MKILAPVIALTFLASPSSPAGIVAKRTALITIPAKFELKAPPAKVWAALTSLDGFGTLTGFRAAGGEKRFARLGDFVPAQVWSDKGRLIVTEYVPEKELRVTWEPTQGHYLCQKRIVLSASGGGTTVEYWDRYTDDQSNADETAKQVASATEQAISAFRRLVEGS